MDQLSLPPEIVAERLAGEGRRSVTFRARYQGNVVALKVYRQAFIRKYEQRYQVNIARFEYERNREFYAIEALQPFAARPLQWLGGNDGLHLCFLQEFIDGYSLVELANSKHGLPQSVLDAGALICREAEAAGLHDLDLFYKNIMVRKQDGQWLPVLHDFNLLPQHRYPPNPFLALAYVSRLRKKSHRDWRCLKGWQTYSDACRKAGGQP